MFEEIFSLFVLFFSIAIHEVAHASVALSLGDSTAKEEGRLTLNPISHIDPFGTIFLPLFLYITTFGQGPIFGWAKPVPVNPLNFKNVKTGIVKVSLAGPLVNFFLGLFFALFIRFLNRSSPLLSFFSLVSLYNFNLAFFNLIPIPPLDGFNLLFNLVPERFSQVKIFLVRNSLWLMVIFFIFGLDIVFTLASFSFHFFSGI